MDVFICAYFVSSFLPHSDTICFLIEGGFSLTELKIHIELNFSLCNTEIDPAFLPRPTTQILI